MEEIKRIYIDWEKTAKNLRLLRESNSNLKKYVCYMTKIVNSKNAQCSGDCENCKFDIDHHISQKELASVFNVSASSVINWENGKSKPPIEEIFFYAKICNLGLKDVLVMS